MSLLHDADAGTSRGPNPDGPFVDGDAERRRDVAARVGSDHLGIRPVPGRLWHHACALALVLVGLVTWLDSGSMVSGDEGAVLTQVQVLERSGIVDHPEPQSGARPNG